MVSSYDVEWKSVFEEGTLHRTFEIIVEGKIFSVNPSFLAERSSFFETLLFGDFKEKREQRAVLKDVKAKDFEEFLLVLGADPKKRKSVTASNFSIMANFSHSWDVETLREDCVAYIGSSDFDFHPAVDVKTEIDICSACERIKAPVRLLKLVAARLARFSVKVLAENDVHNQLSSAMSTAVYLASQKKTNCSVLKAQTARCCRVVCNAHSPPTVETVKAKPVSLKRHIPIPYVMTPEEAEERDYKKEIKELKEQLDRQKLELPLAIAEEKRKLRDEAMKRFKENEASRLAEKAVGGQPVKVALDLKQTILIPDTDSDVEEDIVEDEKEEKEESEGDERDEGDESEGEEEESEGEESEGDDERQEDVDSDAEMAQVEEREMRDAENMGGRQRQRHAEMEGDEEEVKQMKSPIHLTLDYLNFCAAHVGVDIVCERKNDGGEDAGSTSRVDDSIITLDDDDDLIID